MAPDGVRRDGDVVSFALVPAGRSAPHLIGEAALLIGIAALFATAATLAVALCGAAVVAALFDTVPSWLAVVPVVVWAVLAVRFAPLPKRGGLIRIEFGPGWVRLVRPLRAERRPHADIAAIEVVEHRIRPDGRTGPLGVTVRAVDGTAWAAPSVCSARRSIAAGDLEGWLRETVAGVEVRRVEVWIDPPPGGGGSGWTSGGSASANAAGGG
ncbi:hypothetical protein [Dactylosporangium sp. NPDC051541]|uniref:hypothetical protein n=1 Tax=Dactylosporangium sp. NPDC051541 TaxID=3363977 RepID=UPI00379796E5